MVPMHSVSGGVCSCGSPSCPAPGKHPRVRWEHFIEHPAGCEEVGRWWRRWPGANLGIVTGRASGLLVLDVDPRNGGDLKLAALEHTYGAVTETVEAVTGGGGWHLYFRYPGEFVGCGRIAEGLDIKGEGGIVVSPPSRHASGRPYRWSEGRAPGEVPLAAVPPWVLDLQARSAPAESLGPTERVHLLRSDEDREEFARLWQRVGIELSEGDRYYLCPFHPDHRPSLHIDAEGCRFYCFGCGHGGGLARLRQLAAIPLEQVSSRDGALDAARSLGEPAWVSAERSDHPRGPMASYETGRLGMELQLSDDQAAELHDLLNEVLGDLSHEIAATDNAHYRALLRQRVERLSAVKAALDRVAAPTPG